MRTILHLCHACGQVWQIEKSGEMNQNPPRFCPSCGEQSLEQVNTSFGLAARCFDGVDRQLLTLLYAEWSGTRRNDRHQRRFVDYLRHRLSIVEE